MIDGSSYRVLRARRLESPNDARSPARAEPGRRDSLRRSAGTTPTAPRAPSSRSRAGTTTTRTSTRTTTRRTDFGGSPNGGAGLDFDFPADLSEHAQFYRDAVVTNLFYGCNTFHDLLYRYGFDEASGNFQDNNYGRGGLGGDYVRCEARTASGTNNANFSTPTEPTPGTGVPRMQMYLWPGNARRSGSRTRSSSTASATSAPGGRGTALRPRTLASAAPIVTSETAASRATTRASGRRRIAIAIGGNPGCQSDRARPHAAHVPPWPAADAERSRQPAQARSSGRQHDAAPRRRRRRRPWAAASSPAGDDPDGQHHGRRARSRRRCRRRAPSARHPGAPGDPGR